MLSKTLALRFFYAFFAALLANPTVAIARVDTGDGWVGGTGILCQKKWAFDRDVKAGKLKIVGYGYRDKELESDKPGSPPEFWKTVVLVVTGLNEADANTDLYLMDVIQLKEEGEAFCYYDKNDHRVDPLSNFHFYHGENIDLAPKLAQPLAQLQILTDSSAGISIGIPEGFQEDQNATSWGHTWRSVDGTIKINSLAFPPNMRLLDVYNRLTSLRGRILTTASRASSLSFLLSGHDADGTGFYVFAVQDGNVVRGYSLLFPELKRHEVAGIIQAVAASFGLLFSTGHTPNTRNLLTPEPTKAN